MNPFRLNLNDATEFDFYLSDRLTGPIGDDLPRIGFRLLDKLTFQPVVCRICGRADGWLPEGATFVCEHPPIDGVACRVIDDIRADAVIVERTGPVLDDSEVMGFR